MTADIATLRSTFAAGLAALSDPASDPLSALLALASIVLVLLVLVLVTYLAVITVEGRRRPAPVQDSQLTRAGKSGPARVLGLVVGIIAIAAIGYGWTYSASDAMCARCHFTSRAIDSHAEGAHADIACRSCHVGPGVRGAFTARIRGGVNLATQILGNASDEPVSAEVRNGACIACHENVASGVTVARSIRMRHSDVLELGHACTDCHNTEAHGTEVRRARYPRMGLCIGCHDGIKAASECDVCHSEDVGVAVRRLQRPFAKTNIEKDDCRGCHPIDTCNACHGLEMPHSQEFVEGFHARKGLTQTAVCLRCHDIAGFCNTGLCHMFPVSGQGAKTWRRYHEATGDFVAWHQNARDIGPGFGPCSCHETDVEKWCNYCHGPQPER